MKILNCILLLLSFLVGLDVAAAPVSNRYLIRFKSVVPQLMAQTVLVDDGMVVEKYLPEISVYVATPAIAADEQQIVERLKKENLTEYIEKDQRIWSAIGTPNDPSFSRQTYAPQISLAAAWDRQTGDRRVVVAVSDTGVDMNHPDLQNQIWSNSDEIAGNGVDDDGNGFVDDVHGWDFAAAENNPLDENGHGTHVAGIIGAEGNNGIGVAGMSWAVSIMPVRFLDANGRGNTLAGVESILYAVNNGARIVNASWGGDVSSPALQDALRYAGDRGVLVVCAAGNNGRDTDTTPQYPSSYDVPSVLSILATQVGSSKASFSNFGRTSVDIGAPGASVYSTYMGGSYRNLSGTSMAAPVVSGIGALMLAQASQLSMLELRNGLLNAVTPRQSLQGQISTEGEINALRALEQLANGAQVWPAHITLKKGQRVTFTAFAANDVSWQLSQSNVGRISQSGEFEALAPGETTVTARTSAGTSVSSGKIVVLGQPNDGGGCNYNGPATNEVNVSSVMSFGLPLIFGLTWRTGRRRRYF